MCVFFFFHENFNNMKELAVPVKVGHYSSHGQFTGMSSNRGLNNQPGLGTGASVATTGRASWVSCAPLVVKDKVRRMKTPQK